MDRLLFVFGLIVFIVSFIFFVMNFVGEFDGMMMVITIFLMMNAGIAMGISELLQRTKRI